MRKTAFAAVVAAVYAVLTLAIAPIAYGQSVPITYVLCILPFFFPFLSGTFHRCIIAIASLTAWRALCSLSATLLAACARWRLALGAKNTLMKALACLPPVVF
jgi:uncharacterized membrane protein